MPTIIISGQPGSGNSTTAKLLARELGLKHWSAGDYTKQFGQAAKETERAVAAWEGAAAKKSFHADLDAKVIEIAREGNVVIDGKLAIHFAGKFAALKIYLKAPVDVRAQRVAQRDNVTLDEARKVLVEKETLERTKWKQMYGFDYGEQERQADMIIDTSALKPEEIVWKIRAELRARRIVD